MSLFDVILSAVLAALAVVNLRRAALLWQRRTTAFDRVPRWWLGGELLWRGRVRARAVGNLLLLVVVGIVVLFKLSGGDYHRAPHAARISLSLLALACVALFLADVSIYLFNRPKLAVPPHLRGEPGLIAAVVRKLGRRPAPQG